MKSKILRAFCVLSLIGSSMAIASQPVQAVQLNEIDALINVHATHNLTIRDLVTHRSGLPRHDSVWYNSKLSRAELLSRLQYLEPTSDLREKFQYNNLMYAVAGVVIEKVTGQRWLY